jgi:hypothetical protein
MTTIKNGKYGESEQDRLNNYAHPEYPQVLGAAPVNPLTNFKVLYKPNGGEAPKNQMLLDRAQGSGRNSKNSDPDQ